MRWTTLMALGCGAGGATSQETFVVDYAEATCEWLEHCSDSYASDYPSDEDCEAEFVADFDGGDLPTDCEFDLTKAQSCIDQIRENDCENDVFEGGDCYRVCGRGRD
jgi:hypothetical protein